MTTDVSVATAGVRPAGRFVAKAGLPALLGLLYASTCAGPYGIEDFIQGVGPGLFILLLFVTPWFWGVPTAMAAAELAARETVEGGYYRWAHRHLGSFWGFQAGAWSVLAAFLDNALYPVLFARTIGFVIPGLTPFHRWLIALAVVLVLTWINYRGIVLAGATAVALNLFLMAPLVWICIAALGRATHNPFVPFQVASGDFGAELGLSLGLALWLYSGYAEVSTASEEFIGPSRNIPLGLLIVTPLAILSYALPYIAGLATVGGWQNWEAGELTRIGQELGGLPLATWTFSAGLASQAVVFLAYLLWSSRIAWAMAADRYLPRWFTVLHPRYGTPHRILWCYAAAYAVLVALPFEDLLVADMWVSGAYELLLLATLVRARRNGGARSRGFRVPGGVTGLALTVALPSLTFLLFLALTAREHALLGVVALLLAPAAYGLTRLGENR